MDDGEARGLRGWIQTHQSAAILVCVAVVAVAVVAGWLGMRGRGLGERPAEQAWYFDLNTGQQFVAGLKEMPPIAAPSGPGKDGAPAGVRIHMFSCGECSDAKSRFVGYLGVYTPEAKKALFGGTGAPDDEGRRSQGVTPMERMQLLSEGYLIAKPGQSPEWLASGLPDGLKLIKDARMQCAGGMAAKECFPQ